MLARHAFAIQVLRQTGIKLYANNTEILTGEGNLYDELPEYTTYLSVGKSLLNEKATTEFITYEDLRSMGLMISGRKPTVKLFPSQQVEYYITYASAVGDLGRIPKGHRVIYDRVNKRLKLIGPNSRGFWVSLKKKKKPREYRVNPLFHLDYYKTKALSKELKKLYPLLVEEKTTIPIPELPIMISENGELICIPQGLDSPVIGVFGETGTGKSMLLHGITDRSYWKLHRKVLILNDTAQETINWSLPWTSQKFITQLQKIGEPTLPLPMVYLTLNTNTLKNAPLEKEGVGFRFSINFKEAILNYENFFEGIPGWSLKNSGKYLRKIVYDETGEILEDGLANVKNYYQIQEKIENLDIDIQGVKSFLLNLFRDLYSSKIFDIVNGIDSHWIVEFPDGDVRRYPPWTACMLADLIPSIQNFDSRRKMYHASILSYILNDVFLTQTEDDFFRNNNIEILLVVDELGRLLKNPIFAENFENIVAEHRMSRLPIAYATQYLENVPESILINTQYNFFFRQRAREASIIAQNFPMLKTLQKQIKKLKKFECVLASTEALVKYDSEGNRTVFLGTESEPIRGYILPSVSQHKPPRKVG